MGFFSKLEKLSEKYIEGFFKSRFGGHIQPAEIARLLLREMRDHKTVSVSRIYVPNEYTVLLGPEDWRNIEPVQASLSREMQEFLTRKAADRGYRMAGPPAVKFDLDESLAVGTVILESGFSALAGEDPVTAPAEGTIVATRERFYGGAVIPVSGDTLTGIPQKQRQPRALLVQKLAGKDGMAFPLAEQSVSIGRKRSNDISLDDVNVSRVHASVDFRDGNYYIADLGSTNGTFVNGTRVDKKKLQDGDRITVGHTVLEFRVV